MPFNIIQTLVMGFVSGLAEILPISAEAHRGLLDTLFSTESEGTVFLLLVHIACFLALSVGNRHELSRLREADRLIKVPARRRGRHVPISSVNTIRLLRSCGMIVVFSRLFTRITAPFGSNLLLLTITLILNGALLLLPGSMRSGNKDSRNMLRLDGLLMGLGAGLAVIPGMSLMGCSVSLGLIRGIDKRFALRFSQYLLMISLGVSIVFDALAVISGGLNASAGGLLWDFVGALCAFVGASLALKLIRHLTSNDHFGKFGYYCCGMALVCLCLYLFV